MLALQTVLEGQRGCEDAERAAETLASYEAWAQRAGSQEAAFTGEAAWPAERRFERLFERLGFRRTMVEMTRERPPAKG